ncbi:MAG TPA: peptidylprolyl isomerase [Terriglobales bacterium]|jgi:peptidyl-prolyl cis-trans isomerase SurA|nr:peptidylprolyl isomerase [Terriglobales bacterium]
MTRHLSILAIVVVAAFSLLAADTPKKTEVKSGTVVEEIIARINNHIITRSEFDRSQQQVQQEGEQQNATPQDITSKQKNVLRDLVDQQLLLQKGDDLGITAETDLVKRLDEIRKQMNLATMDDLAKAAQEQGVSYEEFKENLRENIITQKVIQQEVGSKVNITPAEIQKYYKDHLSDMTQPEQVRLSEILISTQPKPTEDPKTAASITDEQRVAAAQAKANQVYEDIEKGARFDDVAKKDSDGPTAAQGGDLGYFKRGTLAKELEDTTFGMKAGEITKPIRTKQGFVILEVTEHPQAGVPPEKEVEGKIQDAIYLQKLQPALRAYLTKLREDAYIDIKPGYTDSGASPNETKPIYTTAAADQARKHNKKKKRFLLF